MRVIASAARLGTRLFIATRFWWSLDYSWRLAWVKAERS